MNRSKLFGAVAAGGLLLSASGALAGDYGSGDFPPNAQPGKCYEKVLIQPVYESYTEQIVDIPGRTETRVIPAVYGEEVRQVLVREERVEYITVPATYRTVTETIVIKAASVRTETIPAVYETITERVLVRAERYEWRRGVPPSQRPTDPTKYKVLATGEVLCLVLVPAEYSTVTRQVLKSPPRTIQIDVPAETQVVTRQVIDQDARVEKRVIPAEYKTMRVRVVVTAERTETYTIAPVYKTVTKKRMVTDTRFEWRMIECETPPGGYRPVSEPAPSYAPPPSKRAATGPRPYVQEAPAPQAGYSSGPRPYMADSSQDVQLTPRVIRDIQDSLGVRGYYKGKRDGTMNHQTKLALYRFQEDNNLDPALLTSRTLLALGVPLP
ncbi:hypothetical protein GVN21_16620 [Caulobacter sp. SLTY]|uniref:peptidoglycan-binding domain-containing protein n=1 Tax=Caulobacter sp. SLTY TaxID=2683262 RepID=UPI001411C29D|nr:putative peptidoglycan binding domain-containing protein [Caulobacter sp. SLTY]NBB16991.1 hypothetical protein [Caulobacter sp. SLTY]